VSGPLGTSPALIAVILLALGCQTAPPPSRGGEAAPAATAAPPSRTLTMGVRYEIGSVAAKVSAGITSAATKRLFNAALTMVDGSGSPRPYLVEALPQLDTPTWRVSADGRMETAYRLRAGLTWHDGTPLTAEDFVFAWRVYTTPGVSEPAEVPWPSIDEVRAIDPRTFVIAWNKPYADAETLTMRSREFPAMPRHALAASFERDSGEVFAANLYWTREYLAAGPFKLERWEPGAFIEATPFDGYVLGRPKIERIKIVFISDSNTALSNILAGELHLAADTVLRLEQQVTLKREWETQQLGRILQHQNQWRAAFFQFRPDFAGPKALQDVRVRRALAHSVDREPINAALYGTQSAGGCFFIAPPSG